MPIYLQKHVCLNYPPPQPESGDIPDQTASAEESTHETEPQGSEAPESSKVADSGDSSRTLSSPLSATSSKSKKRGREDDDEVSSASKHVEEPTMSQPLADYDFFGGVALISE